ncbi:HAMP domain-containing protein [Sporolactobacillus shoreae]|uniref:histidine kinase n=1 Tax=Sporolactobacillus shoreae TaxID=1465501 RepID=A0A4Z0GPI0_9BACL|nr:ATP-binding protein [Sporolactobacillus shoreae]TGA98152.1 HAMP domain-containing protein [Sporolactobacillus shoreae]
MIWRGIITKLWATIIAIVAIALVFLTILLLQFFENSNLHQTELQMHKIGTKSVQLIENGGDRRTALNSISDISGVYSAGSALVTNRDYWFSAPDKGFPRLNRHFFQSDPVLNKALVSGKFVEKQGAFSNGGTTPAKMIIIGLPVHTRLGENGALYIFQTLNIAQNAIDQSKKLIYISTGIAIILTTFFAFFLSTRIGAPLRRMRTAVLQVARGNFDINVPVVTRDEVGDLAVAFNKMRDDLKANMTALNQEKEQLAGILDNMADGVVLLDENGRIKAKNPPATAFVRSWAFEHDDARSPSILTEMLLSASGERKQQIQNVTTQGRFWVVILTPLYSRQKIRGAVAVLRDMTEEQHIDQMKKGFVANVSHELRTPVSMIQGYSEAIIDGIAETDQEKTDMAKIILDESKRLGRLVNELLDLAKLEAGHFQLNKKDVPLIDFFSHTVNKFSNLAEKTGIRLELETDAGENDCFVFDPDRVEQVMTNLIDNAIRHTSEEGWVHISVHLESGELSVKVRDSGTGIAEEDLPFVFERFYKADKARTRGKSGTGLGLAIAKHIIDAHGGEISVNSRKEHGTTFQFSLPDNGD